jgi:butyryl-CoA dehydrogenase
VAWQWLLQATAAQRAKGAGRDEPFYDGKLRAAQYWFATEVPRVALLAKLCRDAEDSYLRMAPDAF